MIQAWMRKIQLETNLIMYVCIMRHVCVCRDSNKEVLHAVTRMVEAATPALGEVSESEQRPWASSVLGLKGPSTVHPRSPTLAPRDYLKERKYLSLHTHTLTLCTKKLYNSSIIVRGIIAIL